MMTQADESCQVPEDRLLKEALKWIQLTWKEVPRSKNELTPALFLPQTMPFRSQASWRKQSRVPILVLEMSRIQRNKGASLTLLQVGAIRGGTGLQGRVCTVLPASGGVLLSWQQRP